MTESPRRVTGTALPDTLVAYLAFLLLACLQQPGRIAADTKYDLHSDPVGFLGRSLHLWTDQSFAGQVQNQSYGYLFPQGPFFALGHLAHIPAWLVERLWWALVLTVAFTGVCRVAAAIGIRGVCPRVVGGLAYALAPRMLSGIGAISSEVWPAALAPWVMLPVIRALQGRMTPRRAGAGAALALAMMGAVNAVATAFACLPAVLWWALHRPGRTWWRLAAWWAPLSVAVSLWWLVPLVLLGQVSPPFLDHIESAAVTTRWAGLAETVRGTGTWVPFVSAERVAGAGLTSNPALVLATGVVAAAGLAGVVHRRMPGGRRLSLIAGIGVLALSAAWLGPVGGGFAGELRALLDGPLAPLRNLHKADPLLRLPLALGLAHLASRVPSGRRVWLHPERSRAVATSLVAGVALAASVAPVWHRDLAPAGAHRDAPGYWREAADWLSAHAPVARPDRVGEPAAPPEVDPSATTRALVVPGSSFAVQFWGVTRDEPLQPLASTPWAVRDSVPLQPAPGIRALDVVQRHLADGRPGPGLASTLAGMGIGYLVVRNDLAAQAAAPSPVLVHQSLSASPGLTRVVTFGEHVGSSPRGGTAGEPATPTAGEPATPTAGDAGLRPGYPAIEIYRVDAVLRSDTRLPGPPRGPTAPYVLDAGALPVVAGAPEALARLDELAALRSRVGSPPRITRVQLDDARAAGLPVPSVILSDSPADRETDFGRVDHHSSAIRAAGDPLRGLGTVADYAASATGPGAPGQSRARVRWTGARLSASSSASDSAQPGRVLAGTSPAAAVDDDPRTAWRSGGLDGAFGQWLRLDLDEPADRMQLTFTVPESAAEVGPAVTSVTIRTDAGSTTAYPVPGRPATVALPPGRTSRITLTAAGTADGTRGRAFEISGLQVRSGDQLVAIRRDVELPPAPDDVPVAGWILGQDLPGRDACVVIGGTGPRSAPGGGPPGVVPCSEDLRIVSEEPGRFSRILDVPAATSVDPELVLRPRPGTPLTRVLSGAVGTRTRSLSATGAAATEDPRGSAAAAVDGDPASSWNPDPSEPSPTVRLTLPERTLVSSIRLWPPRTGIPAAPVVVTIDTGVQRSRVDLSTLSRAEDGSVLVRIPTEYTDHVDLRLDEGSGTTGSGESNRPWIVPGVAEVAVLDPAGARIGAVPSPTDEIVIPCGDGPRLTVDGEVRRFSVRTTRHALLSGIPVTAVPCGPAAVHLRAGERRVEVDPGEALTVGTLGLGAVSPPGGVVQDTRAVEVTRWDAAVREIHLPAAPRDRVLVIPGSVNPGWAVRGLRPDGGTVEGLRVLTVNGWQQGVVVPGGTGDLVVRLTFPLDVPYRAALVTGPVALVLVLVLWLLRGRDRAGAAARPRRIGPGVGAALVASGAGVLGGPLGFAIALGGTLSSWWAVRRWGPTRVRSALVVVGAAGVVGGAAWLSTAPWPSATGYAGDGAGPQVLTLTGLLGAALAVLPWRSGTQTRPRSSRRPAGTSTKE